MGAETVSKKRVSLISFLKHATSAQVSGCLEIHFSQLLTIRALFVHLDPFCLSLAVANIMIDGSEKHTS